jgi:N-alpha-acetyltransferase 35, NatC auxiliary subunit
MNFGSILSLEGFELTDAMSALEVRYLLCTLCEGPFRHIHSQIMDPRMDSGMTEPPSPFNPNQPLLPAEVCWILDRSFACEVIES